MKDIMEYSLKDHGSRATGAKMDIEGAEIEILERKDFPRFKKLAFEYHFQVDPSLERFHAIMDRLKSLGYDLKRSRNTLPRTGDFSGWMDPVSHIWARLP